jgi:hypothetical protein
MIKQRLKPELDILESSSLSNIIDNERPKRFSVVRNSNSPVFFLASRVPELRLHSGAILHHDILGCKFNADRRANFSGHLVLVVLR